MTLEFPSWILRNAIVCGGGDLMYWWQWVLQITGAWFYLGLLVAFIWSTVLNHLRARDTRRPQRVLW